MLLMDTPLPVIPVEPLTATLGAPDRVVVGLPVMVVVGLPLKVTGAEPLMLPVAIATLGVALT